MEEIQMTRVKATRWSQNMPPPTLLSAHEIALLRGMAAGNTNVQLGVLANRSEKTVRNQLTRLYAKLGASNRAEAVAIYMRMSESDQF